MSKVLIVEDTEPIARMIERGLKSDGYTTSLAGDGLMAIEMLRESNYNLVVLDLMLPKLDGWQVCERLRESGNRIPILDADRAGLSWTTRCAASTPAPTTTCPSRSRSPSFRPVCAPLLRRDKVHKTRVIKVADLTIDTAQRRVERGGHEIGLSHREYELLEALAAHESQVLSRETIQERIWMDEDSYSNTVDVYINMLRKKVDAAYPVKLIQTVRGAGYTLRVPAPGVGSGELA